MQHLLIILLLLLPSPLLAQITVDAVSSSESAVPGTSTAHNHPIGVNAKLCLVCVSTRDPGSAIQPVTSVSVGGQDATFLARATNTNNALSAEWWYKISPLTGSQSVAVTNDAANDRTVTTVITLNGTATTSTFGTAVPVVDAGSASSNVNVDTILSAIGELGATCGAARVSTTTAAADATSPVSTEQIERPHADSTGLIGFIYTEAGAASSINMRIDLTPAERWAAVGVSVKPAVAGTTPQQAPVWHP